ncbi:hypothetical protein NP493_110g01034 [Ridgeia piscesae]|uniref:Phosphofurin acidic cluster sorting protein 2 n=1 Tax=Ridgeia piscesae TaxID=27915 RepID=A0AAD9P6P0_RIDPI|nr:hypothetical protein NP493_110g01034 [Ridgeia piscesae]
MTNQKAENFSKCNAIYLFAFQNSKRVLRSNEVIVPPGGLLDTELDLSFSLQYPHFLKRDGNRLQVMLQRRKKYKNRTILGYKTLAIGQINMAQVLQQSLDRELPLYCDMKEHNRPLAKVMMLSLSSQPVDHDESAVKKHSIGADRSPDVEISDDDEQEYSSNDDMSDSEPIPGDDDRRTWSRKFMQGLNRPAFSRGQGNIKQKFIALLRRFKATEEALDSEQDQDVGDPDTNPQDIEDLFDELENLSESDQEMDTISVLSTPKPKLRPFFTGRGSTEVLDIPKDSGRLSDESSKKYDSDSHVECWTDSELLQSCDTQLPPSGGSSPPTEIKLTGAVVGASKSPTCVPRQIYTGFVKERILGRRPVMDRQENSGATQCENVVAAEQPRKMLLEQLNSVLSSDEALPDSLILVNASEWQGQYLSQVLQEPHYQVICTCSSADVKATIAFVVSKIQKLRHGGNFAYNDRHAKGCNSNSQAPSPIKIAVAGGDSYINSVLRPYIEQFSHKSPDWQNYIKFLIIPLGGSTLGKYLSQVDLRYSAHFNDQLWKDTFEKVDSGSGRPDMSEVVVRIGRFISGASFLLQLPVAEAMLTYKEKSTNEESSQIFVPFINEVHIGSVDTPCGTSSVSVDLEDVPSPLVSGSPPQTSGVEKVKDVQTPPNSPSGNAHVSQIQLHNNTCGVSPSVSLAPELLDLQVDYWSVPMVKADTGDRAEKLVKKDSKNSLKTAFRSVLVYRLPPLTCDLPLPTLSMIMITREKKQKIMRLGKKSKEVESKSQTIEGINRLICTSKSQNHPLTVSIDGTEWMGVKFFQLSSQWQTHIKYFPVLIFGHSDTNTQ